MNIEKPSSPFPKMSNSEEYLGFFPNYSVHGIHYCSKNWRRFEPCNLWQAGFPICQEGLLHISASDVDLNSIVCLVLNSHESEAL